MAGLRGELQKPHQVQIAAGLAIVQSQSITVHTASFPGQHQAVAQLSAAPHTAASLGGLSCEHPAAACGACANCMAQSFRLHAG